MRGRGKWRDKSRDNGSHTTTRARLATHKGVNTAVDERATRRMGHPRLFFTKDVDSTLLRLIVSERTAYGALARVHAARR